MEFIIGMNISASSTQFLYNSNFINQNYTNMPSLISCFKTTKPMNEILDLFSDMIYFTKEEKKRYRCSIDKLYQPVGEKLF